MAHQDASEQGRRDAPSGGRDDGGASSSRWEWLTAGIGLCCLVGSLAYLVGEAMKPESPPQPVIEVLSAQPQQGRYLVQLRIHNVGTSTAAALRVVGQLRDEDEVVERRETEFDYLPGRSSREGALFFSRDPSRYRLEVLPESFQQP